MEKRKWGKRKTIAKDGHMITTKRTNKNKDMVAPTKAIVGVVNKLTYVITFASQPVVTNEDNVSILEGKLIPIASKPTKTPILYESSVHLRVHSQIVKGLYV